MSESPELLSTAIKMLFALCVVLAGMFVLFHFMKRFMNRNVYGTKEKLIKILANSYVGVKKSISLVEIPGAVLVLGITNDKISLLSKIEDKELLDRLKSSDGDLSQVSFMDQFKLVSKRLKKNGHGK